jgi:hypothetical protein
VYSQKGCLSIRVVVHQGNCEATRDDMMKTKIKSTRDRAGSHYPLTNHRSPPLVRLTASWKGLSSDTVTLAQGTTFLGTSPAGS